MPARSACAGIDLAQRGVPVVLLDDADRIGEGSRGICYAKRTLEILDRLGVAWKCLEKGVTWKLGKVFQANELLYLFDLRSKTARDARIHQSAQQYYLEHYLVERAAQLGNLEIWRNKVSGLARRNDGVTLTVETRRLLYDLDAIGCRRGRSPLVRADPARPRFPRRGVRGPLPSRGREDEGRLSDGTLVLVRSAVP